MGDIEEADFMSKVSEEKLAQFRKIFDTFDKGGEGSIETTKLGHALRSCGQVPTESWVLEHIAIVDPDKTGKITWEGFRTVLNLMLEATKSEPEDHLLEAFRRFDPGVTGQIGCAQMREVLTTMGDVMNEKEIEEFLLEADPLFQGVINYQGFVQTLVHGP